MGFRSISGDDTFASNKVEWVFVLFLVTRCLHQIRSNGFCSISGDDTFAPNKVKSVFVLFLVTRRDKTFAPNKVEWAFVPFLVTRLLHQIRSNELNRAECSRFLPNPFFGPSPIMFHDYVVKCFRIVVSRTSVECESRKSVYLAQYGHYTISLCYSLRQIHAD